MLATMNRACVRQAGKRLTRPGLVGVSQMMRRDPNHDRAPGLTRLEIGLRKRDLNTKAFLLGLGLIFQGGSGAHSEMVSVPLPAPQALANLNSAAAVQFGTVELHKQVGDYVYPNEDVATLIPDDSISGFGWNDVKAVEDVFVTQGGYVQEIFVPDNSTVIPGQPLMKIAPADPPGDGGSTINNSVAVGASATSSSTNNLRGLKSVPITQAAALTGGVIIVGTAAAWQLSDVADKLTSFSTIFS